MKAQSIITQQGRKFNKLQEKIINNTTNNQINNTKEGFNTTQTNVSSQSQQVYNNTQPNNSENNMLLMELNKLLKTYEKLQKELMNKTAQYKPPNDPSNPYLGKNVYIGRMVNDKVSAKFDDTYNDSSGNITWINGAPPKTIMIPNSEFSSPALSSDSYKSYGSISSTDSSSVSGWDFNGGTICNNSSAWGFPTPYPGTQCCAIQKGNSVSVAVSDLDSGSYTMTLYACGRNCCDGSGESNPIEIQLNGKTFYTINVPVNSWTSVSTTFNVSSTSTSNTFKFLGTNTSSDRSTAITKIQITQSGFNSPTMSYNDCMKQSTQQGYKYFGIQNADSSSGLGYCGVTNNYVGSVSSGPSTKTKSQKQLWSSNTSGSNPGSYAKLTSLGTLEVFDSNDKSIFSTTAPTDSYYWGCYADGAENGKTQSMSGGPLNNYTDASCSSYASDNSMPFYAIQDYDTSTNTGACYTSNNFSNATSSGMATNCVKDSNGKYQGGSWSNAIRSTKAGIGSYIKLHNNGNLTVNRGQSPSDNQGSLWSTQTKNQAQDNNQNWDYTKGKYASCWVYSGYNGNIGSANGFILYPNEYICSENGSVKLIMQSDGNLVLYTSSVEKNSITDSQGNTLGGYGATALYELSEVGNPDMLGKLAYINNQNEALLYPDSKVTYTNAYTKFSNANIKSNNVKINGSDNLSGSVNDCQDTCNSSSDCGAIMYNTSNNQCYFKNTSVDESNVSYDSDGEIYMRNKQPSTYPAGVENSVKTISSVDFKNFSNVGKIDMNGKYGLAKVNSHDQQKLDQLEGRIKQIANKLDKNTNQFKQYHSSISKQNNINNQTTSNYTSQYQDATNRINQIKQENPMLTRIENNSDINVLKDNYEYVFWSILGVGTVIAAMSLLKK